MPAEGLSLWLRSDSGLVEENGRIIQWKDISGNHCDAAYATPVPPEKIAGAINGLPAIRFNGKNTGLETKKLATFPNKRGSLFVVMRINGRSERSSVGVSNVVSTYHGDGVCWQLGAGTKNFSFYDGIGGEGFGISQINPVEWGFVSIIRNKDTLFDLYHNGRSTGTIKIKGEQPDSNSLKIGYNGMPHFEEEDISEVMNGDIAEIIIYNRDLGNDELVKIHEYLSSKYGIEIKPLPYYMQWWFIGLAVLTLALFILLLVNIIQKQRIKKELHLLRIQQEIAQERIRISKDIHDEIGSGLSKIALVAGYAGQHINENKLLEENIQSISKTAVELVENMRDLIWALNQEDTTLDNLAARIYEFAIEYTEDLPVKLKMDFPDFIPATAISKEIQRNVFLAFKEALHNCIKHSGASEIVISFNSIDSKLNLEIGDNGKGFIGEEQARSGNGLRNMEQRIKAVNGIFSIKISEEGVKVRMEVPLS
jgi:signal transduction histidine kinase